MIKANLIRFLLFLAPMALLNAQPRVQNHNIPKVEKESQSKLSKNCNTGFFIENKGQWPKQVRYLAKVGGMNVWITDKGAVYDYYVITKSNQQATDKYSADNLMGIKRDNGFDKSMSKFKDRQEKIDIKGHVVASEMEEASANPQFTGIEKCSGYYNYFKGNDKTKWVTNVSLYKQVRAQNVYDGIDVRYYYDQKSVRYDYIVKAGADLGQIRMRFEGQDDISVTDNGELLIKTSLGEVRHAKLLAYQSEAGDKILSRQEKETIKEVPCKFVKQSDGSFGFKAEAYDNTKPLIVDPLVYSTYLGGTWYDEGYSIAVDDDGNSYITGITMSDDFPTTPGGYNNYLTGYCYDVFVTKLDPTGSELVYSTYIGGSSDDYANSIAIDASGNAYITGYTYYDWDIAYPTTTGAYNEYFNGGADLFVTKLNPEGSQLVYSTFIGGGGNETGTSIAVDASGSAFITGMTDFYGYPYYPTTPGTFMENNGGGYTDAFITKLNPDGSGLIYSTFIGGDGMEYGNGIDIDNEGNAYITGYTYQYNLGPSTFPVTPGAYSTEPKGSTDAYILKLNPEGSSLVYSTFLGGWSVDCGNAIAVDDEGSAYITGYTESSSAYGMTPAFPTTAGAYMENFGGEYDAFITKLNPEGSGLAYSTIMGGSYGDFGYSIKVDADGNAYITGVTNSTDYPVNAGIFGTESYYDASNIIVTKLNADGSNIAYSAEINSGSGQGIDIDDMGYVYVTGFTSDYNYPVTGGAFDLTLGGAEDAFVTKIKAKPAPTSHSNVFTAGADGYGQILLEFQAADEISGCSGYLILRKTGATAPDASGIVDETEPDLLSFPTDVKLVAVITDMSEESYLDKNLPVNKYYSYELIPFYWDGAEQESYTYLTTPTIPTATAFANDGPTYFPTDFRVLSVTRNSITLAWTDVTEGSLPAKYLIKASIGGFSSITLPNDNIRVNDSKLAKNVSQGVQTVTFRCLDPDQEYSFEIFPYRNYGRIYSYKTLGDIPQAEVYLVPDKQASNITLVSRTASTTDWEPCNIEIRFIQGSGQGRLVICKGSPINSIPLANFTDYTASSDFGNGSRVDGGGSIVYKGTGNSVNISNLTPGQLYYFKVFEYNGSGDEIVYNMDNAINNPVSIQALAEPSSFPEDFEHVSVTKNSITLLWTDATDWGTYHYFAPDGYLIKGSPDGFAYIIKPTNGVVERNSLLVKNVRQGTQYAIFSNLPMDKEYYFEIFPYKGSGNNICYKPSSAWWEPPIPTVSSYLVPSVSATNLISSNVSRYGMDIGFTPGSGQGRLLICKTSSISAVPLTNWTEYTADASFTGGGSVVDNTGKVVYTGSGNLVSVSSLENGKVYYFRIIEMNGSGTNSVYNMTISGNNSKTFATLPRSIEFEQQIADNESIQGLTIKGIYPNPATDYAELEILAPDYQQASLKLYDISGRLIEKCSNGNLSLLKGNQKIRIDLGGVETGGYIIEISSGNELIYTKIIVEK